MKLLITLVSFVFITNVSAQWSYVKSMPKPLSKHTATLYNGKVYVFGKKYTFMYNPSSNSWQTLDTVTNIGDYKTAVTIKDKIYLTGDKLTLIYKPSENDWDTLKPDIPDILSHSCATTFNNKLYVIGGDLGINYSNIVLVYNPDSNKWSYKAKMYTARRHPGVANANGKFYVMGGFAYDVQSISEVYNPQTDEWSDTKQMPSRRYTHTQGNIVIKGKEKIFIAGGYNDLELVDFHIYDPEIDKWYQMKDMNEYRYRFCSISIDNCIYVFGGFNSTGSELSTCEKICINSLIDVEEISIEKQIIYPNPSSSVLNINISDKNFTLDLFDANGRKTSIDNSFDKNIDISMLPKGIYFYYLQAKNKVYKGKIILN